MTDQIASITLKADVADLKTASNELDKLGEAAAGAVEKADDLNSVFRAGAESAKQGSEGIKEQQAALKGLLENIDPVNKALNRLDEQQAALRNFQTKGFLDTDDFQHYNKILDDTRLKLTDTGEAAAKAQAELAVTQAAEKQSAALKNLLGSIDPTIRAFSSLDEQHAQLVSHFEAGRINSTQFEHFNTILNQTRERLSGVADVLPEALSRQEAAARRAGISVGQYSAAMRTLPAQFTDIATQLAGGQSPFLILLQQGGQIKDQFGGVKGALSGVGDYLRTLVGFINPVTIGVGGLVVGLGAMAVAWYKGSQEAGEFNKQLILTGNYSARSASQLTDLAQKIGGSSGKVAAAARTLAEVVGAGTFKPEQLETVTRAALAMQEATGQSVDTTIKNFQKLYTSPTKAVEDLNSTLHFLTSAQYDYISSLERRGDKEGAAAEASKAYSQAEQKRSQQILDNMGLIERAAGSVSKALKGMWDELLNIGRPDAPNDMLRKMQAELAEREKALLPERQRQGYGYSYETSSNDQEYDARRKAQLSAISALKAQIAPLQQAAQLQEDINASVQQGVEVDNKRTDALIYRNRILEQSATWQEKRTKALSELWKNVAIAPDKWSDQQRQQAVDAINKQFHPDKTAKSPAFKVSAGDRSTDTYNAETLALQAQLKTLQEHRDINDVISQQRKQQWDLISKFSILEEASKTRTLSKDEQSLLSTKGRVLAQAEVNAGLGDQIAIQERLNRLQDSSQKYVTQMTEKTAALRDSAGLSSRQAQQLREEAQLRQGWLNGGGKLEDAGYAKELAALRNYYAEEDKLRGDWKAGAVSGWNEYLDAATNTYDAVKNVASSTLTGLSDMLTELMTTGTASVKEFGKSMLKMILEVTNRLMVAYAVQAAMGWISGGSSGGSTPSGAYANAAAGVTFNAKGGVYESSGLSKYVNGVYDSPQYFTFQGASKFAKGGVFAEAGAEAIMPLTRDSAGRLGVRAQGGGGVQPQVNIDIYVDNKGNTSSTTSGDGSATARALGKEIEAKVTEILARAARSDGLLGRTFQTK